MDKKIANNIIVGVMVAFGFVAFVYVLFNLGGGSVLKSQYTLYGTFHHVKGLHMGSEVSLSGLRIGVIRKIEISPETKELKVEFSVSRDVQEFVRKDSLAQIRTQGVLGDKYIEVSFGSPDQPVLKNGDTIMTNESEDIFAQSGKLVGGLSKKFEAGGDFDSVMQNLSVVTKNLAVLTEDLKKNKTGDKLGQSVAHLEAILGRIDRGEGSLGGLINDPTVYEDLKTMTGGAKRSAILQYFMKQFMDGGKKTAPKEKEEKTAQ
ncbi:MlaD family protein [bacterium]|nr:MlaD family protein [bacterium]